MDQLLDQVNYIRSLYLDVKGADVWFLIDDERIPAHKFILKSKSAYYRNMFNGLWLEISEINLKTTKISLKSFKEFIKLIYSVTPNLTMENIEGVMHMARLTLTDDIFMECENFLENSITKETIFFTYQLALRHESKRLKVLCEDKCTELMTQAIELKTFLKCPNEFDTLFFGYELAAYYQADSLMSRFKEKISANIDRILKSKSFLKFPIGFLEIILRIDTLACEEKDIYNACVAWAKAACKRNGLNPSHGEDLRSQLGDGDVLHQIRFTSMTRNDATTCIDSYPGLLTGIELVEIYDMFRHLETHDFKRFNWTPRYFDLEWDKGESLECSRFVACDKGKTIYEVSTCEVTEFTCNRCIILTGFTFELSSQNNFKLARILINEINADGYSVERLNQGKAASFSEQRTCVDYNSFLADVQLNKCILLRPNYTYEICIRFKEVADLQSNSQLKSKIRIDQDIVLNFNRRGIVASLSIRRFDDRNILQKMICNSKLWFLIFIVFSVVAYCMWDFENIKQICLNFFEGFRSTFLQILWSILNFVLFYRF